MGKADKLKEIKNIQRLNDIDSVLGTTEGRRFLWRILEYCGVYQDVDTPDTNHAFKQLGKRQVGLFLLGICSERSDQYIFKMMTEAKNAAIQEEKEYERQEQLDNSEDEYITTIARGSGISTFL